MFDAFLAARGEAQAPFTDDDYYRFVDGRPRYEGVRTFLESRKLDLPYGDPDDPPERDTICGLGNRKNEAFNRRLRDGGVEVFDNSVRLIHMIKAHGLKTALVTSSRNAKRCSPRPASSRCSTPSSTATRPSARTSRASPTRTPIAMRWRCWASIPPAPSASRMQRRASSRSAPRAMASSSASTAPASARPCSTTAPTSWCATSANCGSRARRGAGPARCARPLRRSRPHVRRAQAGDLPRL
jgi:hypothetical protein